MKLTDWEPMTAAVDLPGGKGSFEVRGLNLDDFAFLMQAHRGSLEVLVKLYGDAQAKGGAPKIDDLVSMMLTDLPQVAALGIALAADSKGAGGYQAASRLPVPVQIDALTKIGRLTFEDAGGVENFLIRLRSIGSSFTKLNPYSGKPNGAEPDSSRSFATAEEM